MQVQLEHFSNINAKRCYESCYIDSMCVHVAALLIE